MNKLYFGKVELSEAMESIVSLFLETGEQFGMETVFSSETNSFHITVFLFDDGDKDTFPYTMYEIKYRERGVFFLQVTWCGEELGDYIKVLSKEFVTFDDLVDLLEESLN
jgi:hypothetical protein